MTQAVHGNAPITLMPKQPNPSLCERVECYANMNNCGVALTGRPGVGKTTLIRNVVSALCGNEREDVVSAPCGNEREDVVFAPCRKAGGMLTSEIRKCGHRVGFSVTDLATDRSGILAHIHQTVGHQIGRYRVCLADLETIGVAAIENAVADSRIDLVVIDEIAPMELVSARFVPAVEQALASGKALLISTHAHTDHPLIHDIRRQLDLVRVKLSNRDTLTDTIVLKLRECMSSRAVDRETSSKGGNEDPLTQDIP